MSLNNSPEVICFGEVLWDLLPSGKVAGGAPMNVAYHLNNFGIPTGMVSRVGEDELGEELTNFLKDKEIDTTLLQFDGFYPTGTVDVILDEKGSPSYTINKPVAWDYINLDLNNSKAIRNARAMVFGSLACRTRRSKETLLTLAQEAKIRVFDVNLRAPFYGKELLETLLKTADIVKMNDEELELIAGWYYESESEENLAKKLKAHFQLSILIVTQGSKGAFLVDTENEIQSVVAKKVEVKDTIGSGDSFLAGFLYQYFNDEPLLVCLDFAARTGALVATKRGGTPKITEDMVVALH